MNGSEGNRRYSEDGVVERETERVEESNKREEQRIRKLETKAVQNVNLYFIFQAVILASTSLSSSTTTTTTCHNSWIPISLSLIAAITNFLAFFAVMSKILKSREQLDQSLSDLASIKLTRSEAQLNQGGGDHQIVRPNKKWKRRFVACFSIVLFAGFSAIVMYGCHRILCHPGDKKCVKLC